MPDRLEGYWLAIDCALSACLVALRAPDGQITSRIEPMQRGHAERLVPLVHELLGVAAITPRDVAGLVVTVGPGSFAGVRVGLATARTWGLVNNVPVRGVSTMAAISASARIAGHNVQEALIVLETKRRDFYAQGPNLDGGCYEAGALAHWMMDRQPRPLVVIGDATERLAISLQAPEGTRFINIPHLVPEAIFDVAAHAPLSPEPLYWREADTSQSRQRIASITDGHTATH